MNHPGIAIRRVHPESPPPADERAREGGHGSPIRFASTVRRRPKVLMMIATDQTGGPGKGLFQFLRHVPPEALDYLLCNFDLKGRPLGQFIEEARRRELNLILLNQRATLDVGLVVQARRAVLAHDIDIIQTHGPKPNVLGFILHAIWGKPWIAFAHGYTYGSRKTQLYNWLDRKVLPYADRVVTVSESMRTLLLDHGVPREKVRLIYNAVEPVDAAAAGDADRLRQQFGISPGDKVVGVVGRLSPEKGQIVLLRAVAQVATACPALRVLMLGDGPDQEALERHCDEHGLRQRVIFAGYRENISNFYQLMDVLALPSLTEGLPNTVLEAMAYGVPVLASRVGGVPEIIGDGNGVLVPPGDADALASAMTTLLDDAELRRRIGTNGRSSLYPRFAADHRARQILSVYGELLAEREPRASRRPHA
jgi:glycosyltransferase involved in cell wall biosynthesis